LGDRDRERVRDHERAHEQRDPGEGQQRVADDLDEAARLLLVLLRLLGPAADDLRVGEERLDLREQGARVDAGLRLDADRVERAHLVEELLRGRLVEDGERRAAYAHFWELGDAGDRELPRRAERLRADPVADVEPLAARRRLVDDDLAGAGRPAPGGELRRVELLAARGDRETERGRAAGRDDLAVLADQLQRRRRDRSR